MCCNALDTNQPSIRDDLIRHMSYEMSKQIAVSPEKAEELGKAVLKYIDTVAPEKAAQIGQAIATAVSAAMAASVAPDNAG